MDCRQLRRMEKGASIVATPKKCGKPGRMEKEASIFAAPKRWEYVLGPTVNKGTYASDDCCWIPSCHNDVDDRLIKEEWKASDSWDKKP